MQVFESDAVAAGIRKWCIGSAGTAEFSIQLDIATHIHHQNERWAAFFRWQGSGVLVGLVVRPEHGLVPAGAVQGLASLLGFQYETATFVQIDKTVVTGTVWLLDEHAPLEHIGVVA